MEKHNDPQESSNPVKEHYSLIAKKGTDKEVSKAVSIKAGYTEEDLSHIPQEAILGQGCGNSVAAANLKSGEMLLDIGCGAGMDLFLAGVKVAPDGKAVGVDFSEDMVELGRKIVKKYDRKNTLYKQ